MRELNIAIGKLVNRGFFVCPVRNPPSGGVAATALGWLISNGVCKVGVLDSFGGSLQSPSMQFFIAKTLAAGFAVSMAFSGSTAPQSLTLQSFGDGAPNANIPPAASYPGNPKHTSRTYLSSLDLWLEKLIVFESNGRKNIKILDHNGAHSFGCLQFQKETFEEFGLKYNLIAPDDEINDLLYDCNLQKEIAKRMIEENYDNWRRWYTSVKIKKLGLPPRQLTYK